MNRSLAKIDRETLVRNSYRLAGTDDRSRDQVPLTIPDKLS